MLSIIICSVSPERLEQVTRIFMILLVLIMKSLLLIIVKTMADSACV